MRPIKFFFVFLIGLSLVFIKYFLFSNLSKNYNSDIYNYRAFSLINNGTDEHGFKLPLVFQSRLGYEMPLNSYLYTTVFALSQNTGISEYLYEILLLILLSVSIYSLSKSKWAIVLVSFCPYFLWPGNWTEKIFIPLVFFAIKFYRSKKLILLAITSILLFLTSTVSLPLLIIYLLVITFQKKHAKYWKFTLFMVIFTGIFIKLFLNLPYSKTFLISQNFNLLNNIEYKNAVNQLRGEDFNTTFQKVSRLLHNKTALLTSVLGYSIRTFDPSLWFFNGDKNIASNRQLIPLFLPLYILVLFFIPLRIKKIKKIFPYILIAAFFVGINGDISQSKLLIILPFIILIIVECFKDINTFGKYIIFISSLLIFFPMISISIDHRPQSIMAYSTQSTDAFYKIITLNQNKNIYITDEIYPDLGPQLSYMLKILPQKNTKKISEIYQPYIRSISPKIEIISPDNPNLNIVDPKNINPDILNSLFFVSTTLYKEGGGKDFRNYVPVIYDRQNNPLIYQLNYEIPKK